jgi:predicted nucleotidyltransferase
MTHDERRQMAEKAALECIRVLKKRFGVREAYVFGSVRGDSPWHSRSDLDIAVEGLKDEKYWDALNALDEFLPEWLELDLITLESARPELVVRAKGEFKMPKDNLQALRAEVELELSNLERIVSKTQSALEQYRNQQPSDLQIAGIGKYVHDFYMGVERIFERIVVRLGSDLPAGGQWHMQLLEQMEREVPGQRPAVIDRKLMLRLLEYLRFRHRFQHVYGDELKWFKLRPRAVGMSKTVELLREQVSRFLDLLIR